MKVLSSLTVATVGLLVASSSFAYQGEMSPAPLEPFQSTRSRAEVRAEALHAMPISNGGTGVHQPTQGGVDPQTVRMDAMTAARQGGAHTMGTMGTPK